MMQLRKKIQALAEHQGFRRYAANTSWMLAEKFLRMTVGLLVGVWVARYLGPEQFGLLSYAQSFVFLFTAIATLGLDSMVVRELVKDDSRRDELLGTSFGMKLIGAVAILPILGTAVYFTSNDAAINTLVFVVAISTIFQSFNVIDFYYQAKVQSKYVALANSIALGVSSVIKVGLIFADAPLIAFAIMVSFESLVVAIGLFYYYFKVSKMNFFGWKFRIEVAVTLLKESWPLIISTALNSIYMKIDQVMLGSMASAGAVGVYAAATRLSEVWYGIGVVVARSLFPAVVNAKIKSYHLYLKRIKSLFFGMTLSAYILIASVYFFSDKIISLLYGSEFFEAGAVLAVHIVSVVFVYLGVSSGRWLIAEGLVKLDFYRNLLGVTVNIVLNYYLIDSMGALGAAYASLASYVVAFYIFDIFVKDMRPIFYIKTKSLFLIR